MDKMNLLPENEYSEFESRRYINPNLTVEATDSFIDKLRATQQANAQQTAQQTAALGTDVPSNEGGLMGTGSYWSSRYATPQNSALVADLRATAQAKALNDALSNEQAMWQKRYTEAYRAYQKRQHDKDNQTNSSSDPKGDITTNNSAVEVSDVATEAIAGSRYQKLLMKYLQAGYPKAEAEARAKEDFSSSISVDAPVEPYAAEKKAVTTTIPTTSTTQLEFPQLLLPDLSIKKGAASGQ